MHRHIHDCIYHFLLFRLSDLPSLSIENLLTGHAYSRLDSSMGWSLMTTVVVVTRRWVGTIIEDGIGFDDYFCWGRRSAAGRKDHFFLLNGRRSARD